MLLFAKLSIHTSFKLVWLSGFLANGQLPRMSRQSANDKGDNKMIPGSVRRYPNIYLTAEENPGKYQLRDRR